REHAGVCGRLASVISADHRQRGAWLERRRACAGPQPDRHSDARPGRIAQCRSGRQRDPIRGAAAKDARTKLLICALIWHIWWGFGGGGAAPGPPPLGGGWGALGPPRPPPEQKF